MAVDPVPSNYPSLIPIAAVENCAQAIEFYKSVLGATEHLRLSNADGTVAHAELRIGGSMLMLGQAMPAQGFPATTLRLSMYVPDCDAVFRKAIAAGAKAKRPPADQFYGDRSATVVDPWGLEWSFATRQKDMSAAEMESEMRRLFGG